MKVQILCRIFVSIVFKNLYWPVKGAVYITTAVWLYMCDTVTVKPFNRFVWSKRTVINVVNYKKNYFKKPFTSHSHI